MEEMAEMNEASTGSLLQRIPTTHLCQWHGVSDCCLWELLQPKQHTLGEDTLKRVIRGIKEWY